MHEWQVFLQALYAFKISDQVLGDQTVTISWPRLLKLVMVNDPVWQILFSYFIFENRDRDWYLIEFSKAFNRFARG